MRVIAALFKLDIDAPELARAQFRSFAGFGGGDRRGRPRYETEQEAEMLRAAGCHNLQGFLFGRPMPIAEFRAKYEAQAKCAERPKLLASPHGAALTPVLRKSA